jgi:hypothetical protein
MRYGSVAANYVGSVSAEAHCRVCYLDNVSKNTVMKQSSCRTCVGLHE